MASSGVTGCLLTRLTRPSTLTFLMTMKPAAAESSSRTESMLASLKLSISAPPGWVVMPCRLLVVGREVAACWVVGAVAGCVAVGRGPTGANCAAAYGAKVATAAPAARARAMTCLVGRRRMREAFLDMDESGGGFIPVPFIPAAGGESRTRGGYFPCRGPGRIAASMGRPAGFGSAR